MLRIAITIAIIILVSYKAYPFKAIAMDAIFKIVLTESDPPLDQGLTGVGFLHLGQTHPQSPTGRGRITGRGKGKQRRSDASLSYPLHPTPGSPTTHTSRLC